MDAYKTSRLPALATLEKIAEEIPSGVSPEIVAETIAILRSNPYEVTENLRQSTAEMLKTDLRTFWDRHDVERKLNVVKNLKVAQKNESGSSNNRSLQEMLKRTQAEAKSVSVKKEWLLKKLKEIEEQNRDLEKLLKTKADLMKTQMSSVKTCDFIL